MITVDVRFPTARRVTAKDNSQFEQKHPRANGGEFAKKGTASTSHTKGGAVAKKSTSPFPPKPEKLSSEMETILVGKLVGMAKGPFDLADKLKVLKTYDDPYYKPSVRRYAVELLDWLKKNKPAGRVS